MTTAAPPDVPGIVALFCPRCGQRLARYGCQVTPDRAAGAVRVRCKAPR